MRLAKLELLAFGHFRGVTLDFSAPGLHIVLGRNEAGKSTSLRAITGLLYGIEHKTQDAFSLPKLGDLRIGGTLESSAGERLRFQRRKGNTSTLLDPQDKPIDEAVLRRFLAGVTRETFVHAYGLDHDTLAEGARALLEGKGDLGESLFDASVGGGGGVQQLVAELNTEAERLFKPKASNPILNEALKAHELAHKKIKETQRLPEAYVTQEEGLAAEIARRETLLADKRELELRRARLGRASKRAPRERERAHLLEIQRSLGAVAQKTSLVAALEARFAAYEHALEMRASQRAEVDRVGERLADAMRRAQLTSSLEALRGHARAEERVKPLLKQRTDLVARLDVADREIRRAEVTLTRFTAEPAVAAPAAGKPVTPAVRDALAAAIERARALGGVDERLHVEAARLSRQRAALAARAGTELDAFVALRPPAASVVAALVAESDEHGRRVARGDEREAELAREAEALEREAAKNEGDFAPPDAAALRAVRTARDEAWRGVRAADAAARAETELAFDRALREADVVADQMIAAADRVTALARLRAELDRCAKQREKLGAERGRHLEDRARVEGEAKKLFVAAGIGPCELGAMAGWLATHAQIVIEHESLVDERAKLDVETERRDRARADLRAALARSGGDASEEASLSDLLVDATTTLDAIDEARRLRTDAERVAAERTRTIADQRTALEERVSLCARDRDELAELRAKIASLIEPLGLGAEATDEEVNRAIESLREVFSLTDKRTEAEARLKLAEANVAEFEADLHRTATALALALESSETEPRVVARELFDRARRANECAQKLASVDALLAEAGDPGPLDDEEIAIVADQDRAEAEQQELGERIDELERDAHQSGERIGGYRLGLESMRKESNAADAAATAQHHLARVREGAERWARVKLAALILQREIERYREENQGPLLGASSKLFARLTLGAFVGIKAGFDDKDRPCLRCVRDDGTSEVDVAGLSDGTRDQLYLSLRLASLLRRAASAEPMPLVLDDVLIQLDDQRAAAALAVLAEVSRTMQVLFFTHHARLVELARAAVPAADLVVHILATKSAPAAAAST